ncbi:hypothetical protein [Paraburkholderia lacunae]|uniref:hypothetical protein n=1 Tax=Paraburkholderia lacunae TaxID=2211104 RepID=UPI001403890D|nr:hypothetical protein [Paraburkholderia lacunae]
MTQTMLSFRIVQPKVKTTGCGVTDHSTVLLQCLREKDVLVERYSVPDRQAARKVPVVPGDIWILQVSIYGFDRKGVPLWLPAFIKRAKRRGLRLIVYFHELWVLVAPRMSSAFWLAPLQKGICEQLVELADYAFFNTDFTHTWGVEKIGSRAIYSPTFSNVGEPGQVKAWGERKNIAVVFGSEHARRQVYEYVTPILAAQLASNCIERVVDIGAKGAWLDEVAHALRPHQFEIAGTLSASEVSALLTDAKWGFFNTPWGQASKSGVFAAYATHGVAPVSIFDDVGAYPAPTHYPLPDTHFVRRESFWRPAEEVDTLSETISRRVFAEHVRSNQLVEKILEVTS